jgi:hypothetical protein
MQSLGNAKTDPPGRFRYWLLSDFIQKDGATMPVTESSPPTAYTFAKFMEQVDKFGLLD